MLNQVCAIIDETFSDICEKQNAKMNENERWSKTTKTPIRTTTDEVFVTQHSNIESSYIENEGQIKFLKQSKWIVDWKLRCVKLR